MSDPLFLILLLGIPLLSQWVSTQMKKRFVRYSTVPMPISGREAAEQMLHDNGIHDVQVIETQGELTDHYDPRNKTVNLSEVVYRQRNVAAVAVASHECGHAVQHATGYPLLSLRSKMVPLLRLSNVALPIMVFGGASISQLAGQRGIAMLLLLGLGMPALFSLVTLPVEFNASRRALNWLDEVKIAQGEQYTGAKKSLFWAAMTYVIGALGAIAQAFYFLRYFLGRRKSA